MLETLLLVPLIAIAVTLLALHRRVGQLRRYLRVRTERLQKDLLTTTLLASPRYCDPRHLCRFEGQVYSQHGEDGIISEILARIGHTNRTFVEIGAGDGTENNTRYRLNQGWTGFWFEADAANIRRMARTVGVFTTNRLRVEQALITAENAPDLLSRSNVPVEFDLLSLDIDRNTSHVWRALGHLRPRIVVIEYNASIPRDDLWEVDYRPDALWDGSIDFGASLATLQSLGESLGYLLVGCELSGTNAFFVRRELVDDQFAGSFTARALYEPPRYYLLGRPGYAA